MSREAIAQLTRDIDRAMDNTSIAGRFAVATTLACGLIRAMGNLRAAYESRHAARMCDTEELRALRSEVLDNIDAWSSLCAEIIAKLPTYSGQQHSPASDEYWECLRALVDVGWVYAVDKDTYTDTDIDITKMGGTDGEENDQEDNKKGDQER